MRKDIEQGALQLSGAALHSNWKLSDKRTGYFMAPDASDISESIALFAELRGANSAKIQFYADLFAGRDGFALPTLKRIGR